MPFDTDSLRVIGLAVVGGFILGAVVGSAGNFRVPTPWGTFGGCEDPPKPIPCPECPEPPNCSDTDPEDGHATQGSTETQPAASHACVTVEVIRGNQMPDDGKANVCMDGPFDGQSFRITNSEESRSIDVEATATYICSPCERFVEIQLRPRDARRLFGADTGQFSASATIINPPSPNYS